MDMNAVPEELSLPLNMAGGRGTRIPDLPLLLAIHAARQETGQTARIVRESSHTATLGDEPSRLMLIFGGHPADRVIRRRASGAFNARVAALLATDSMIKDEFTLAVSQQEKL